MKKYYSILQILTFVLLTTVKLFGQNYIEQISTKNVDNGIQINLATHASVSHEILNFDSRSTTLVKIFPLTIQQDNKDALLASLSGLGIDIQALELGNNTVLLAFKNVLSNRLSIKTNESKDKLRIHILDNQKISKSVGKSNSQLSQEYYQKAMQLFESGEYSEALTKVRSAIKLNPGFAEAYFLGGQLRYKLKDWVKAKYNFKKAAILKGEYSEANKYLNKINSIENDSLTALSNIKNNSDNESDISRNNKSSTNRYNESNITSTSDSLSQPDSTVLATSVVEVPEDPRVTITDTNSGLSPVSDSPETNPYAPLAARAFNANFNNYLQLGFFLLIISFLLGWILYLKKSRKLLQLESKKLNKNHFTEVLSKIQENIQEKKKPKKSFRKVQNKQPGENRSMESFNEDINSQRSFKDEFNERPLNPLPYEGDPTEKVCQFSSVGYSVEEIARMLNMGKGEVKLILNFRGRHSPMTPPDMRFNLAETV